MRRGIAIGIGVMCVGVFFATLISRGVQDLVEGSPSQCADNTWYANELCGVGVAPSIDEWRKTTKPHLMAGEM